VREVPIEEASRFGIMNTHQDDRVYEFEEKPPNPRSNLASMGIYIFSWPILRAALIEDDKIHRDSDFGKHIIPMMLSEDKIMYAYRFDDYWKDVGTIESYWVANMDLIKTLPDFNLYDDFWKIYTDADHQPPQFTGANAEVRTSLLSEGCEVYGSVYNSVLGPDVFVDEGTVIKDSIIMQNCRIGRNCVIDRAIIDESSTVGSNVQIGVGENIPNEHKPKIYDTGITVIGDHSSMPDDVTIGKNCVVSGNTPPEEYEGMHLESGKSIIHDEQLTG
jgi:glucose-1-phosphate adenylyltransferase